MPHLPNHHVTGAVALTLLLVAGCEPVEHDELTLSVLALVLEEPTGDRDLGDVVLPTHLDLPTRDLDYSLRARVVLPEALSGHSLDLRIVHLPAHLVVEADGELADDLSPPLVEGYRVESPRAFRIPAAVTTDGVVELRLAVRHRWSQSGWWDTAPVLLLAGTPHPSSELAQLLDVVLVAVACFALLQIGLACLLVYAFDRRRKAYLWFGIQVITVTVYPLHIAGLTQWLLGSFDVPLLAIALFAATTVSIFFTSEFFQLATQSRVWLALAGVGSAIAVGAADPHFTTTIAGPPTVLFLVAVCVFQITACARLVHRHSDRASAAILLLCWIQLTLLAIPDFGFWVGLGAPFGALHTGCLGLALFAFGLTLLLSRSHIVSMTRADALNVELEDRVAQLLTHGQEIESLNVELRRQIGERSAQIHAALSLGTASTAGARELAPGELVQGRYRVARKIAKGGMGMVYEVERLGDGRRLAMKIAHDLESSALARLAREARVAAEVSHPNIVGIVDVDVASEGFLFLVMELVEGPTLQEQIASARPPGVRFRLEVLSQVARGLEALHARGIVHRDLKAANVLLTGPSEEPCAKITDFGISRASSHQASPALALPPTTIRPPRHGAPAPKGVSLPSEAVTLEQREVLAVRDGTPSVSSDGPALTGLGDLVGTPHYIAPELVDRGMMLEPPSDLFSFGVLAFDVLTGRRPFAEPLAFALLQGHPVPDRAPLADLWPGGDPSVIAAIERCLAIEPGERPTAAEVAEVLEAARDHRAAKKTVADRGA